MNILFWTTGTFLAGISVGALGFSVAERHFRTSPPIEAAHEVSQTSLQPVAPAQSDFTVEGYVEPQPEREGGGDSERWDAMNEALHALGQRVSQLEEQVAEVTASVTPSASVSVETTATLTGKLDQGTLVAAGVEPELATDYLRRQSRLEMQRLELRDRASREGWLNSDRFSEQLSELEGDVGALREEIGDDSYDRFLYLTGQPNRVMVASVIDESPAQLAGIEAGDTVLDYADSRVFSFSDLRNATRSGERGENILVRVQRNGQIMELILPRGPLGIRLDSDSVKPAEDS